ncbi:MAG: POTRA domain-containing protein [Kofleriaceae bacterium]
MKPRALIFFTTATLAIVLARGVVVAQPADEPADPVDADTLTPKAFDPNNCQKKRRPPATVSPNAMPVTWSDYELTGDLVDSQATVRALLTPTLSRHNTFNDDTRDDATAAAAAFGYHVIGIGTREAQGKTKLDIHVAPMPMVRKVDVNMGQWLSKISPDEVRRRMRVRSGAYLPWMRDERACMLLADKRRIEEYLHDEGYFEAIAAIRETIDGVGVKLRVQVYLGPAYSIDLDRIVIPNANGLPIPAADIREQFQRKCKILFLPVPCIGKPRFTRAQHQIDVQEVVDLFHRRGYPEVRVRSDFDPGVSIDRRSHTVRFALDIEPRRHVEVSFEGVETSTSESLRKQLTFDKASSTDSVEANESARAITAYLQSRGYFDARVTWRKEQFAIDGWDSIIFRIDRGESRTVRSVAFSGNYAIPSARLASAVATKPARFSGTILGSNEYATSPTLAADVNRLVMLYRREGYRDASVRVYASTDPAALGSAALTAALVTAERGNGLYVRFALEEGQPTLLTQVHVDLNNEGDAITKPEEATLCDQVLGDLAEFYNTPGLAKRSIPDRCVGVAPNLRFREDDAAATRDRLKDRMFTRGRPRTDVDYAPAVLGPHRIAAHYRIKNTQELKVGKIVIRGNFRTRDSIISGELKLKEGGLLTSDALAESTRRLRNTGLFDSVNIKMPDLDTTSGGAVNAVVEVTERYDFRTQVDLEVGYSSFNGAFIKLIPGFKNLFGTGISLDLAGTIGINAGQLVDQDLELRQLSGELTLRIPSWLVRRRLPIEAQIELNAFHRRQDTPRFGILRTTGVTLGMSRTWNHPRNATRKQANAQTLGIHYDYRSRQRNIDVLRPIGADDDDSQVPITTTIGSFGLSYEWEQRVDRSGSLQPLAPESGFRWDAQLSFAWPPFSINIGQDTFIKASVGGSYYVPVGDALVLRADARYDHGFPLGGAALLPEVERFFGGGDSTVRGYDDDRLATEIVQVGLPPLENITQIRILPAGGNIRVLGSADAQLRIYKLLSTALFFDAGLITNQWSTVTADDIRPSVGMALIRLVTPFGAFAFERAVPLRPRLGDDPRGRWHISFAARAQF